MHPFVKACKRVGAFPLAVGGHGAHAPEFAPEQGFKPPSTVVLSSAPTIVGSSIDFWIKP
jgi:hypothetical protein